MRKAIHQNNLFGIEDSSAIFTECSCVCSLSDIVNGRAEASNRMERKLNEHPKMNQLYDVNSLSRRRRSAEVLHSKSSDPNLGIKKKFNVHRSHVTSCYILTIFRCNLGHRSSEWRNDVR